MAKINLENSNEIKGNNAIILNKIVPEYEKAYAQLKDLEETVKALKEQIISLSVAGVNKTNKVAWKRTDVEGYEKAIKLSAIKEKDLKLYQHYPPSLQLFYPVYLFLYGLPYKLLHLNFVPLYLKEDYIFRHRIFLPFHLYYVWQKRIYLLYSSSHFLRTNPRQAWTELLSPHHPSKQLLYL